MAFIDQTAQSVDSPESTWARGVEANAKGKFKVLGENEVCTIWLSNVTQRIFLTSFHNFMIDETFKFIFNEYLALD